MVLNTEEIFNGIAVLAEDRNMRVTVQQSAKGALICGATCFVGGLVAGPVGMAIGGTLGGVGAWKVSQGKSKSVGEIIKNDLTEQQKENLVVHLQAAVRNLNWNADDLLSLLMDSLSDQEAVITSVVKFLEEELGFQLPN